MPIIGDGENVSIEYKIPDEIGNKIPPYFYAAFAGELFSVFGLDALQKDEDNSYGLRYFCGTAGWLEALKTTCKKLNLDWLMNYYYTLDWYDSDIFDGVISERIISEFIEAEPSCANSYYHFLLQT